MKKYFKVKIGFGSDDFISIDETELRKAIIAQGSGQVAIFNGGTVSGNNIISITPDWCKVMGWNRDYQLTGSDYVQVGERRQNEYRNFIEDTVNEVKGLPPVDRKKELSAGSKLLADKFKV
jgi:hypothetical protein